MWKVWVNYVIDSWTLPLDRIFSISLFPMQREEPQNLRNIHSWCRLLYNYVSQHTHHCHLLLHNVYSARYVQVGRVWVLNIFLKNPQAGKIEIHPLKAEGLISGISFFPLFNALLVLCWWDEGPGLGNLPPQRVPFPGCGQERSTYEIAAAAYLVAAGWSRASCSVGISTVPLQTQLSGLFSDLLLLPYLGTCIQMQIDLNPINPFNMCASVNVCTRTFVNKHHTRICTYINSP